MKEEETIYADRDLWCSWLGQRTHGTRFWQLKRSGEREGKAGESNIECEDIDEE